MKETNSEWSKSSPDANAYGRPQQHSDDDLTQVGPGTPMGELMRRYWHPIAISDEVTDLPKAVRILGEDLVLFRDGEGSAGLLYPRCMHRGTTLYYGKVEDKGIRCCYHGWLFDVKGNCLDQPCEPDGGKHLEHARQPWYPVTERYGLIFTYMGPPDKMPVLPRYDNLENIGPDEEFRVLTGAMGSTGDQSLEFTPYSWLHMNDNVMDPFHVWVLHSTLSGPQFSDQFKVMPEVDFFYTDEGVCYSAVRELEDGRTVDRISSWLMPHIMSVPDIWLKAGQSSGISWVVPRDDSSYMQVFVSKNTKGTNFGGIRFGGKLWGEMTDEEHQLTPGDFEAQAGQGLISLHSDEHIVTSDRGIMMQRRVLRQEMQKVAKGEDPINVTFDESEAIIHVRSGNFFEKDQAAE